MTLDLRTRRGARSCAVPLYLVAIRTTGRVQRCAVLASCGAEALTKARAALPLLPRDAFHVARQGVGDVLPLPMRGRPPKPGRAPVWDSGPAPSWADIS